MIFKNGFLNILLGGAVLSFYCSGATAETVNTVYTASITSQGKVLTQSPAWITGVEHHPRRGYFTDYKVVFEKGAFKRAPGFCAVSVTDVDSLDDVFYAHAKLSGTPTQNNVKVVTHQLGSSVRDSDSSKSFMLMCLS